MRRAWWQFWMMTGLLVATGGRGFAQMPGLAGQEEQYPFPEKIEQLPPLNEPLEWWVVAAMVAGGLLLSSLLVLLLFRERPKRIPPKPPALRTALTKLAKLREQLDELEPAEAAHRVSVILREFQVLEHDLPAPYRTSEELYERDKGLAPELLKIRFGPLAEVHDRLAFGPQLSRREDVKALVDDAMAALEGKVKPPPLPPVEAIERTTI